MKAAQSFCENLYSSLEVVKRLDFKVERLESLNKTLTEKLGSTQEPCSTSMAGTHEKVDSLKTELDVLIAIRLRESTKASLH